jgi:hypothetical protein
MEERLERDQLPLGLRLEQRTAEHCRRENALALRLETLIDDGVVLSLDLR